MLQHAMAAATEAVESVYEGACGFNSSMFSANHATNTAIECILCYYNNGDF